MKSLIIAQRGASAYAPENTLAVFQLAFELGAMASNWTSRADNKTASP